MRSRWAAAASAAAAALLGSVLLGAGGARAHEGGVRVRPVLDRLEPAGAPLTLKVEASVAPLVTVTATGADVAVPGESGEPFLRLSAVGAEINLRSPTSYRSLDPLGGRPLPAIADPGAEPEWKVVASGSAWSWFDPRLRPPPSTVGGDGVIGTWVLDLRAGGRDVRAEGHLERIDRHGHFRSSITRVEPALPRGAGLRLVDGVIPAWFARNDTDRVLEIAGLDGEPFLRIGPSGVEGNTRSPTYYLAGSRTIREVPSDADAKAAPQWTKLSPQPVWAWLEYRARLPEQQRGYALGPRERVVLTWTTPATFAGRPVRIAGTVRWVPAGAPTARRDGGPGGLRLVAYALGGLVAALLAVVLALRRRPDAGSTPPASVP